jgi:HD-like signal output (HDOD) protein
MPDLAVSARTHPLVTRLPAFSPVAVKLLGLVSDDNASFTEIAKMLSLDPTLAGQVLRTANSGMFGRRVAIQSLLHAIAMLGLRTVSHIAITAAISFGLPRRTSPWMRTWWRHSIATALVAEHTGAQELDIDFGYTAGLLHGIGQLALFQQAPQEYPFLADAAYASGADLRQREQERFGSDHAELAGLILAEWGLPANLQHAVAAHHMSDGYGPLARAVQTGCSAAEQRGFGQCGCCAALPGEASPWSDKFERYLDGLAIEVNRVECSLL